MSFIKKYAMDKKINGMLRGGVLAPLIEGDENSSVSSHECSQHSGTADSNINTKVKQTPMEMLKTAAIGILLAAGTVASLGSVVFVSLGSAVVAPEAAVFVMAAIFIVNMPYSAYKEFRIIKLPALRQLNNKLREDADHLELAADALAEEMQDLQPEAERATVVEEKLKAIAAERRVDADKVIAMVKENERIISEMKDNLRQRIVQDVLRIVVTSDEDKDQRFHNVELKRLVLRIQVEMQAYGVEFDEEKFYKIMSKDPSVSETMQIVKNLIPPRIEDGDSGIREEEEDGDEAAYDMFRMTSENSLLGSSVDGLSLSVQRQPSRLSLGIQRRPSTLQRVSQSSQRNPRHGQSAHSPSPDLPRSCDRPHPPTPEQKPAWSRTRNLLRGIRDSETIDDAIDSVVNSLEGSRGRLNKKFDRPSLSSK